MPQLVLPGANEDLQSITNGFKIDYPSKAMEFEDHGLPFVVNHLKNVRFFSDADARTNARNDSPLYKSLQC